MMRVGGFGMSRKVLQFDIFLKYKIILLYNMNNKFNHNNGYKNDYKTS